MGVGYSKYSINYSMTNSFLNVGKLGILGGSGLYNIKIDNV